MISRSPACIPILRSIFAVANRDAVDASGFHSRSAYYRAGQRFCKQRDD